MNERQASPGDDADSTYLFYLVEERIIEHYPNPERVGCLDYALLEKWVFAPDEEELKDPKYNHVFRCRECIQTLRELKALRDVRSGRTPTKPRAPGFKKTWVVGFTAIAAVCFLLFLTILCSKNHLGLTNLARTPEAAVAEAVDLSRDGTTRGVEASSVLLTLPRRRVVLELTLPYFSPGGNYRVAIAEDREGTSIKAQGEAVAIAQGANAKLTVNLDLRNLDPGTYYLSTMHAGDSAPYSYPLTIH